MSNQHPLTSPLKMSALGNSMTTLDGTTRALLTESHADANRMTLSSASLSVLASSAQNALSVVHQNEALVEDMTSLTGRVSVLDQRLERVDARLRLHDDLLAMTKQHAETKSAAIDNRFDLAFQRIFKGESRLAALHSAIVTLEDSQHQILDGAKHAATATITAAEALNLGEKLTQRMDSWEKGHDNVLQRQEELGKQVEGVVHSCTVLQGMTNAFGTVGKDLKKKYGELEGENIHLRTTQARMQAKIEEMVTMVENLNIRMATLARDNVDLRGHIETLTKSIGIDISTTSSSDTSRRISRRQYRRTTDGRKSRIPTEASDLTGSRPLIVSHSNSSESGDSSTEDNNITETTAIAVKKRITKVDSAERLNNDGMMVEGTTNSNNKLVDRDMFELKHRISRLETLVEKSPMPMLRSKGKDGTTIEEQFQLNEPSKGTDMLTTKTNTRIPLDKEVNEFKIPRSLRDTAHVHAMLGTVDQKIDTLEQRIDTIESSQRELRECIPLKDNRLDDGQKITFRQDTITLIAEEVNNKVNTLLLPKLEQLDGVMKAIEEEKKEKTALSEIQRESETKSSMGTSTTTATHVYPPVVVDDDLQKRQVGMERWIDALIMKRIDEAIVDFTNTRLKEFVQDIAESHGQKVRQEVKEMKKVVDDVNVKMEGIGGSGHDKADTHSDHNIPLLNEQIRQQIQQEVGVFITEISEWKHAWDSRLHSSNEMTEELKGRLDDLEIYVNQGTIGSGQSEHHQQIQHQSNQRQQEPDKPLREALAHVENQLGDLARIMEAIVTTTKESEVKCAMHAAKTAEVSIRCDGLDRLVDIIRQQINQSELIGKETSERAQNIERHLNSVSQRIDSTATVARDALSSVKQAVNLLGKGAAEAEEGMGEMRRRINACIRWINAQSPNAIVITNQGIMPSTSTPLPIIRTNHMLANSMISALPIPLSLPHDQGQSHLHSNSTIERSSNPPLASALAGYLSTRSDDSTTTFTDPSTPSLLTSSSSLSSSSSSSSSSSTPSFVSAHIQDPAYPKDMSHSDNKGTGIMASWQPRISPQFGSQTDPAQMASNLNTPILTSNTINLTKRVIPLSSNAKSESTLSSSSLSSFPQPSSSSHTSISTNPHYLNHLPPLVPLPDLPHTVSQSFH